MLHRERSPPQLRPARWRIASLEPNLNAIDAPPQAAAACLAAACPFPLSTPVLPVVTKFCLPRYS
jgi:hypothetical protein